MTRTEYRGRHRTPPATEVEFADSIDAMSDSAKIHALVEAGVMTEEDATEYVTNA